MINNYIVLSEKKWHKDLFERLQNHYPSYNWILITEKSEFTISNIDKINPDKIFIPHWSYIISENIFSKYDCIVFHMTDLPYGRGGSPLQNLILRGHKTSKLSAIKIEKGIDTGDIYLKSDISLSGSAQEIFLSLNNIIFNMICKIIDDEIIPEPQIGESVFFKRRTPDMSSIKEVKDLNLLYDYIRMLDADGYPKAFFENDYLRFEFFNSSLDNNNQEIIANVRITKK